MKTAIMILSMLLLNNLLNFLGSTSRVYLYMYVMAYQLEHLTSASNSMLIILAQNLHTHKTITVI